MFELTKRMTVESILVEQAEFSRMLDTSYDEAEWRDRLGPLLANMQDGDEIWKFCDEPKPGYRGGCNVGYAQRRNGSVIDKYTFLHGDIFEGLIERPFDFD